jgi:putative FmdB family regulatory protein
MPIFEFICQECGWEFEELLRSASLISEVSCPACESDQVAKKLSIFAAPSPGGKATAYWGGSAPASSCKSSST